MAMFITEKICNKDNNSYLIIMTLTLNIVIAFDIDSFVINKILSILSSIYQSRELQNKVILNTTNIVGV